MTYNDIASFINNFRQQSKSLKESRDNRLAEEDSKRADQINDNLHSKPSEYGRAFRKAAENEENERNRIETKNKSLYNSAVSSAMNNEEGGWQRLNNIDSETETYKPKKYYVDNLENIDEVIGVLTGDIDSNGPTDGSADESKYYTLEELDSAVNKVNPLFGSGEVRSSYINSVIEDEKEKSGRDYKYSDVAEFVSKLNIPEWQKQSLMSHFNKDISFNDEDISNLLQRVRDRYNSENKSESSDKSNSASGNSSNSEGQSGATTNDTSNDNSSAEVIEYTYKPGDNFGQVIKNLGLESGNGLWGENGDVAYYTKQLVDQGLWANNGNRPGNIPIGTTIKLTRRK